MGKEQVSSLNDLLAQLNQNSDFKRANRKIRPYFDIVTQIINRRIHFGFTQKDLAQKANTHQSRISKIETGEHDFRLSTLISIAEALETEVCIQLVPLCETNYTLQETEYRGFTTILMVSEGNTTYRSEQAKEAELSLA